MLEEKQIRAIRAAERAFATDPPAAEDVARIALAYGRASARWGRVYEEVETVRGLDEFDPKHMAWETRLYLAELEKDQAQAREILLAAARAMARADSTDRAARRAAIVRGGVLLAATRARVESPSITATSGRLRRRIDPIVDEIVETDRDRKHRKRNR